VLIVSHPTCILFPYTTLFRSDSGAATIRHAARSAASEDLFDLFMRERNRYYPVLCRGAIDVAHPPRPFLTDRHATPHCGILAGRSEEHTSELQSRGHLVCRLL